MSQVVKKLTKKEVREEYLCDVHGEYPQHHSCNCCAQGFYRLMADNVKVVD